MPVEIMCQSSANGLELVSNMPPALKRKRGGRSERNYLLKEIQISVEYKGFHY